MPGAVHRHPAEETFAERRPIVRTHSCDGVEALLDAGEEDTLALVGPFDHLVARERFARNAYSQVVSI